MPFQILSDHPLPSSHTLLPTIEEKDSLKHIETLRARLGFARFKLNHGWESSTLLDVEQLWKQRQQKLTSGLPKPRFTQRDIIDKKIYIPSPGAKYQKAKKQKLLRTYSQPSLNIPKRKLSNFNTASSPKTRQPQQQFLQPHQEAVQQHERPSSSLSSASPPQHLHQSQNQYQQPKQRQQQQQQQQQQHQKQNRHEEKESLYFHHYRHTPSPVWEDPAIDTHSSFSSSSSEGGDAPISSVRNSLDFLSYAIAITENNNHNNDHISHYHPPPPPPQQQHQHHHHHEYQHHQHFNEEEPSYSSQPLPDVSNLSPNLNDEDLSVQGNTEEPLSPPSSPVTSAAKAIMTFVNSQSNRPLYTL